MHLHGYEFAVIGIEKVVVELWFYDIFIKYLYFQKLNSSITTKTVIEMDQNGLLKRNLLKAPLKDTVTVPVGGYTIIRFRANNPGAWLFHCHLGSAIFL
jgi:FtsP/CotA-like multicopper oxidase with cupredoxin domain